MTVSIGNRVPVYRCQVSNGKLCLKRENKRFIPSRQSFSVKEVVPVLNAAVDQHLVNTAAAKRC